VKRKNPKADRMSQLRKRNLPSSPHLPLVDKMGTTEQKIKKEIAIMKKCSHPHVVKLLEVIDDELYEKIYMGMYSFLPILLTAPTFFAFDYSHDETTPFLSASTLPAVPSKPSRHSCMRLTYC
jgi:serine/threonine protein kinase